MGARHQTWGSRTFDIFNHLFLSIIALLMLLPLLYVIAGSFASDAELSVKQIVLIPTEPTLDSYRYILSSGIIFRSLLNSIFITVIATAINMLSTAIMAYPLSRVTLMGRGWIMKMVVFTLLFQGGLIPNYLLVRELGLLDSYWSLWLPGAIAAFNLILLKNFFQQLPDGIEEAAKIDGCNDMQILIRIALPLSMPSIAALTLFYAVGNWNSYFPALMYIGDSLKWPIQVWLRQIVILSQAGFDVNANMEDYVQPPETTKLAVICVATIPILMVYPFLQKYFAKGMLLGSVKG
ncbi:carbohydrate ABC transporter permease [Paenibacillus sp. IB182496]|uniref:Carbohydrate ABC transporter permease n=1 Tax=Paenibacillus sabuli TaxID=2772509 RepID=A0A927GRU4_9BACL|nr:carbohydrate ABC transporter permease [Paenibacillus sabuli]MBD2845042.1 carbohydrate ABC transporter permease [Paenibacillus sabuli]